MAANPSVNTAPADVQFSYVGEDHARDFIRHREKQQRVIFNFGRWVKKTFPQNEWPTRKQDAATMERYVTSLKKNSTEYQDLKEAKELARTLYNITMDENLKPAKGLPIQQKLSQVRYSLVENKVLPLLLKKSARKEKVRILDLGSGPAKFVKALVSCRSVKKSRIDFKTVEYTGIDIAPQNDAFTKKPPGKDYGKDPHPISWHAAEAGVKVEFVLGDYNSMIDAAMSGSPGQGPIAHLQQYDIVLGIWAINRMGTTRLSWLHDHMRAGSIFVGIGLDCRSFGQEYKDSTVSVSVAEGTIMSKIGGSTFIEPIVNFEEIIHDPRMSVQTCRALLQLVMPRVQIGQNLPWIQYTKIVSFEVGKKAEYAAKMTTPVAIKEVYVQHSFDIKAPLLPANNDTLYWLQCEDYLLSHKLDGWLGRLYAVDGGVYLMTRARRTFLVNATKKEYSLLSSLDLPLAVEVIPDSRLGGDPHKFHIVAIGVLERFKDRFKGSFQEMRALLTGITREVPFLGMKRYFSKDEYIAYKEYPSPWPYDGLILQPTSYPMSLKNQAVVPMLKRYWTIDVRLRQTERGVVVHQGPSTLIGVQVRDVPKTFSPVELQRNTTEVYLLPGNSHCVANDPATLVRVKGNVTYEVAPKFLPEKVEDVEEVVITSPSLKGKLRMTVYIGARPLKAVEFLPAHSTVGGNDNPGKLVLRPSKSRRVVFSGKLSLVDYPDDLTKADLVYSHVRLDKFDVTDDWVLNCYYDAIPLEEGLSAFFCTSLNVVPRTIEDLDKYKADRNVATAIFPPTPSHGNDNSGLHSKTMGLPPVSPSTAKKLDMMDKQLMW